VTSSNTHTTTNSHTGASSSLPAATATSSPDSSSSSNKTGIIAGSVVGGVVGLALIGGLLAWLNRHGGCASRSKTTKNGFTSDDYTIDMTQNDFAPTAAAVGGGAVAGATLANLNSHEPLSPFDNNRRYVAPAANYENYGDYNQDVYSQGGYSQEGYSQDGYYPQQQEYGYYDNAAAGYGGYDSARHEYVDYQQKHDVVSPTSAGNVSETYQSADKPNVKDYDSKPNEM
jgi:hypothetical protein